MCDHVFAVSEVMVAALPKSGWEEEEEERGSGEERFEHFKVIAVNGREWKTMTK